MNLKNKLKENQLTIGSWVTLPDPIVIELMSVGKFDWLAIDIEHTAMDYKEVLQLTQLIQARNMECLVRISKNDDVVIKKVLDIGADGVIVPNVNSIEDAEKIIEHCYYPPHGKRGVGLYRAQQYGYNFKEYVSSQKDRLVAIAQIEHISGVEDIEKICQVEGIDGFIIGPYDLSASLGEPGNFTSKEFQSAIDHTVKTCIKYNKPCGFHVIDPNVGEFENRVEQGCKFMAMSLDFKFLCKNVENTMNALRGE